MTDHDQHACHLRRPAPRPARVAAADRRRARPAADGRRRTPTDADVAFYREHGYYVSKPIFTSAELDAAAAAQDAFYEGERDEALPENAARLIGWTKAKGPGLRKNDYASLQKREFAAIVRNPVLGAIAARLAGADEIRLWHDQLLYKPSDSERPATGPKANVGWHTDRGYWKSTTSDGMLTA